MVAAMLGAEIGDVPCGDEKLSRLTFWNLTCFFVLPKTARLDGNVVIKREFRLRKNRHIRYLGNLPNIHGAFSASGLRLAIRPH